MTLKQLVLVLVLIVVSYSDALARPDSVLPAKLPPNSMLIDLGGQGGILSMNYERFLTENFALKVGLGFVPDFGHGGSIPIGNVMLNCITHRSENSHIELGIGMIHAFGDIDVASGTLGYRYQRPEGGEIFRVAFTPIYGEKGYYPWGLIGLGLTF